MSVNNALSGPFTFLNTVSSFKMFSGVTGLPDWLQAAALVGSVILLALALWLWGIICNQFANMPGDVYLTFKYWAVFFPPLTGVVAGGASLIYGFQFASLGFGLGGGAILALSAIAMFVLLFILPDFGVTIGCALIGLALAYYGIQYSSPLVLSAGATAAVAGMGGVVVVVRGSEQWRRVRLARFAMPLVCAAIGISLYYVGRSSSSSSQLEVAGVAVSSSQLEVAGVAFVTFGVWFLIFATLSRQARDLAHQSGRSKRKV